MSSRFPLLSRKFGECLSSEINLCISLCEWIHFVSARTTYFLGKQWLGRGNTPLFSISLVKEAQGISLSSWSLSLLLSAASTKKANLQEKHLYSHSGVTPACRILTQHYTSDNIGSWVLYSLQHSYMYIILLCSLFSFLSWFRNFIHAGNIYFRTSPCGICIYTGKLPYLYYFQIYN